MWLHLTFFGDSSFTLPCAALLFLWLSYNRQWRAALIWGLSFGSAMLIVAVSKVLFMAWHIAPPLLSNFTGVSGHTASATALYFALTAVLVRDARAPIRLLAFSLAATVVLTIALSRLMLHVHSGSEVVSGLLIGALAAMPVALSLRRTHSLDQRLRARMLLPALMLLILFVADGKPAPTQDLLMQIAQSLSGRGQVYGRPLPL